MQASIVKPCSHLPKLSKQSIEQLPHFNYIGKCHHCQQPITKNNDTNLLFEVNLEVDICLHCAAIFCPHQQHLCVLSHMDQKHIFWALLKVKQQPPSLTQAADKKEQKQNIYQIMCKTCGSISQQLAKLGDMQGEEVKKLGRFYNFIIPILLGLPVKIQQKLLQNKQLACSQQMKVFGLKNLGNTCYLNSILQILFSTQELTQIFATEINSMHIISQNKNRRKNIQYFYDSVIEKYQSSTWHLVGDKKKNKDRIKKNSLEKFVSEGLVTDNKFNTIYNSFIKDASKSLAQQDIKQKIVLSPIQILAKLGQYDPKYKLQQQQDAEELLIFIIDLLSQGQMIDICTKSKDAKQRYSKIEELLGRQKLTPVQQIFGSYLASRIVCLGCKTESWSIDFTYHYPVPLQRGVQNEQKQDNDKEKQASIDYFSRIKYPSGGQTNMLESLLCRERLTKKDNYYTCQKCSSLSGTKQLYILDSPQLLIISVKRFEFGRKQKITKYVQFGEYIDISKYVLRETDEESVSHKYELYGVVVHKGQRINSGHYVSYVKVGKEERVWYQFSDEKARRVTGKEVMKQQAYIVVYRRVASKQKEE